MLASRKFVVQAAVVVVVAMGAQKLGYFFAVSQMAVLVVALRGIERKKKKTAASF